MLTSLKEDIFALANKYFLYKIKTTKLVLGLKFNRPTVKITVIFFKYFQLVNWIRQCQCQDIYRKQFFLK